MADGIADYLRVNKPITVGGLRLAVATEVTIDDGAITVQHGTHAVDTEADASSDNLDTITGLREGELLLVYPASSERSVVIRHGQDNIACPGGEDITLAEVVDYALLLGRAGGEIVVLFSSTLAGSGAGSALTDELVVATIAVADASGGATGAALQVDLHRLDGVTILAAAVQVVILCGASGAGQYNPVDPSFENSVTFGTPTKGSIVASGNGWAVVETNAAGEFDCTATNTDDEGLYFWVKTAPKVSDLSKAVVVAGSNSDLATWSA